MDKILVEVYLPAAGSSFDVIVPCDLRLFEAIMMLSKILSELCQGYFISSEDTVMCDKESGAILNINMSVGELGLCNGSKLMLI